jgi:hypothetical protein
MSGQRAGSIETASVSPHSTEFMPQSPCPALAK